MTPHRIKFLPYLILLLTISFSNSCKKNSSNVQLPISFSKEYTSNGRTIRDIAQLPDSGYLLVGSQELNYGSKYYYLRLDKEGNEIFDTTFDDCGSLYGIESILNFNNAFLLYAGNNISDSCQEGDNGFLLKTDQNLHLISQTPIEEYIDAFDAHYFNNLIYLMGWVGSENQIFELNEQGQVLNTSQVFGNVLVMDKLTDGNFIMIGNSSPADTSSTLKKEDINFHVLWQKNYLGRKVASTNDNGFVALIARDTAFVLAPYLIKFNDQGKESWRVQLADDFPLPNDGIDLLVFDNGNILYSYVTFNSINTSFTVCSNIYDSDGNLIRHEVYNSFFQDHICCSLTDDGGWVIVSSGIELRHQHFFVHKYAP